MTASLKNYFSLGPNGTIALRPGSNFSYKGEFTRVYEDTVIDKWFVGDFSSANYFLTVEFDSNNKETLQVLVVARPGHASFTVYGRTSIDDELITIDATVNNSWVSVTASPADPAYNGARISCIATYTQTMLPLSAPTTVNVIPENPAAAIPSLNVINSPVTDVASGTTVAYNFSQSAIFYHSTVPSSDWTANFTNLPTVNSGKILTINIIVPQGVTPYKITAGQVNGNTQPIKWANSVAPLGTSNKTDIWTFSLLYRLGSWTVFGSQTANFG